MKKGLLLIGLTAAVVAAYFIFFNKSEEAVKEPDPVPLAQSKNSDAFNAPFNDMLNVYFELKNEFVDWDSVKATATAAKLAEVAEKVPYNELKADTTIVETAKSFSGSIIAECKGIAGETTIEGKRRSFYTLSENLYNLLRTVKYDQRKLYYDKCPMAFNETEEAFWLTDAKEIKNPYLGNKHPRYKTAMVTCGSIEDSLGAK